MTHTAVSRGRCLLVWVTVTGAAGGMAAALAPGWVADVVGRGSAPAFDALLVQVCTAALLGCLAWAWLVTTVVVLEAARDDAATPRDRAAARLPGVPAVVRRLVLAACGVVLVGGIAAPAMATPRAVHRDPSDDTGRASLSGLPMPERALGRGSAPVRVVHARPAPARTPAVVVVRPGDSLWSIAAARLPAGAGDAEVTAEWHRVYELNRHLVGPDPDLLVPSTRLRLR